MALQKENPKFRLFKSYIIAFFWIGTAIFIDQITKYFAVAYLKNNHAKVLIDGVFELQYLENRGMAFGILQNKQFLFVVGALVICGAILLIYGRIPYASSYLFDPFDRRGCRKSDRSGKTKLCYRFLLF